MRALIALAAAITISSAFAPAADAQEPAGRASVQSSGGRSRVPYTGMNISGQPHFEGGRFRWVTHPRVATVDSGSPAYKVGIRPGDIVMLVNGVDSRVPETMMGEPGKVYVFRIRRGSEVRDYTITSLALRTARPSSGS